MLFSIILNYYMKKASSRYTSPCKCFCCSSYSLSLILPLNKYKLLLRQFLRKRFRYEIVVIQSEYSFVVFQILPPQILLHLDKRLSIRCSHVFNSRHLCGRWGATRPVDECFAPTVAERRPEPWIQGSLRYNKRKP